ncbi:MAG: hypothetical protein FJW32_02535 [Acidobacteria bacterium]|nr:hypothetical protein [Acidobacteriota bacterium]
MRSILLLITAAAAAFAQDITGRWTGAADWTDGAGVKRTQTSTVEIKMENGKVTAHSVNANGQIGAELKINADGGNVNIYRYLTLDDGEHLRWKLELKGDKLVGSFSAQHDRPSKWMYDRLLDFTMTRVKK